MIIQNLRLQDFSVFEDVRLDFVPGLNVFMGPNATGKSHVLKVIYSLLKAAPAVGGAPAENFQGDLKRKLLGVFKPDDIGRLVRRRRGQATASVGLTSDIGKLRFTLTRAGSMSSNLNGWKGGQPCIFLPSREVLAISEGFVQAYENRELAFDETYYDICFALGAAPLRGPRGAEASKLFEPIEAAVGGDVSRYGERFYVDLGGKMEAHLVAEGLRKLASVAYLIKNGALRTRSVLFWDEPEANLNARLISKVVEFVRALAGNKVQVFLATHDYLLPRKLSLLAEYKKASVDAVRFFSFYRESKRKPVRVESGPTLADLTHNPTLDELSKSYDEEVELFEESASKVAEQ